MVNRRFGAGYRSPSSPTISWGVGMVVSDGKVASGRSRNTPAAERIPEVV